MPPQPRPLLPLPPPALAMRPSLPPTQPPLPPPLRSPEPYLHEATQRGFVQRRPAVPHPAQLLSDVDPAGAVNRIGYRNVAARSA